MLETNRHLLEDAQLVLKHPKGYIQMCIQPSRIVFEEGECVCLDSVLTRSEGTRSD
jgi:hypothetical protein